jgi:hypothetical protein
MTDTRSLKDLRADFIAGSTTSMPIAGTIYWAIVAAASLVWHPENVALLVLIGSGMILPAGLLIDKLRGQNKMRRKADANPLDMMFLKGTAVVVLLWPLVIIAWKAAAEPNLVVLGGAVLMGLVWIPYGSAADDPVGLQHAVGRAVASYAAYLLAPAPYTATAITVVVILAYAFTVVRMKKGYPAT